MFMLDPCLFSFPSQTTFFDNAFLPSFNKATFNFSFFLLSFFRKTMLFFLFSFVCKMTFLLGIHNDTTFFPKFYFYSDLLRSFCKMLIFLAPGSLNLFFKMTSFLYF